MFGHFTFLTLLLLLLVCCVKCKFCWQIYLNRGSRDAFMMQFLQRCWINSHLVWSVLSNKTVRYFYPWDYHHHYRAFTHFVRFEFTGWGIYAKFFFSRKKAKSLPTFKFCILTIYFVLNLCRFWVTCKNGHCGTTGRMSNN